MKRVYALNATSYQWTSMLVQAPKTDAQIVAMKQDHSPAVDNTNRKEYTMKTTTYKVKIPIEVPAEELWSAVFGSGFESDPVNDEWLKGLRFVEGSWDVPGLIELRYINKDGHLQRSFYTAHDLAGALGVAMSKEYNHVPCGGKIGMDFSNYDSCVADLLLQVMVYGEEVFA
jgi:hypothetical protein